MKTRLIFVLTSVFAVAILLFGCNGLSKMVKNAKTVTYTITPTPLEVHADSIAVTVEGKYPEKYFNKKATIVINPSIKYGTETVKFKQITLIGEEVQGEGTKISYKGGSFNKTDKIKYVPGMEKSALFVGANASIKTKTAEIPEIEVAKGAIITSKMVQSDEKTVSAKDNFSKTKPVSSNASINYKINKADLNKKELSKAQEIKNLEEFIKKGQSGVYSLKKLDIASSASPDGGVELNANLSNEREQASVKWLLEEMKKLNIKVDETTLSKASIGQDWEGFKTLLEGSKIEDKELILRVLSMYSDPVVREKEIKNISATYKVISETILPKLRRSKLTVNGEEPSRSDSAIILVLKSATPDTLSAEELLYATTVTKDKALQEKALKTLTVKYPNDWRGFNNLGVLDLSNSKLDEAKSDFDKVIALDANNDIAKNNLGVVYRKKGDLTMAKQYFDKVANTVPEAKYNKANIEVINGQYANAASDYDKAMTFNAALVKVLLKDLEGALTIYTTTLDKNPTAESAYLKAIIGARKNDQTMVITNLKQAISLNSSLKDKAKNDLEFIKFKDVADYQAILN